MNSDDVLQLCAALAAAPPGKSEAIVREIARREGKPITEVLEEVALGVLDCFVHGRLSFDKSMGTMADIYNDFFYSGLFLQPYDQSLAYRAYWALDAGEYGLESDGGLDPIDARVLPEARRILVDAGRLKAGSSEAPPLRPDA